MQAGLFDSLDAGRMDSFRSRSFLGELGNSSESLSHSELASEHPGKRARSNSINQIHLRPYGTSDNPDTLLVASVVAVAAWPLLMANGVIASMEIRNGMSKGAGSGEDSRMGARATGRLPQAGQGGTAQCPAQHDAIIVHQKAFAAHDSGRRRSYIGATAAVAKWSKY